MGVLSDWVKSQPETVAEVATGLGIGRVALHRYMSGAVMPRPDMVSRIVAASGGAVTASDLVRDWQAAAV